LTWSGSPDLSEFSYRFEGRPVINEDNLPELYDSLLKMIIRHVHILIIIHKKFVDLLFLLTIHLQ
jgi:hypothetical protein